jgi:hypothetical protein
MFQNLLSQTKMKFFFENSFFHIIVDSILISQAVFYISFPLLYSDTGTYIFSAMDLTIPVDRPVFYF